MVPVIFFFQRQNTSVMRPLNVLLKKWFLWFFSGWSKTFRCKAREIRGMRRTFTVRRNDTPLHPPLPRGDTGG